MSRRDLGQTIIAATLIFVFLVALLTWLQSDAAEDVMESVHTLHGG